MTKKVVYISGVQSCSWRSSFLHN